MIEKKYPFIKSISKNKFRTLKLNKMKKLLIGLIVVSGLAACGNKAKLESAKEMVRLQDSLQMYKNGYATDTGASVVTTTVKPVTTARTTNGSSNNTRATTTSTSTSSNGTTTTTTTTKKKGWSKAAKGTAIGAGAGALTGVLVSKNKGKGAIIGGVLGAGAGYIIGRKKDKKDGRVKPRN